jgi:hypothetical protein
MLSRSLAILFLCMLTLVSISDAYAQAVAVRRTAIFNRMIHCPAGEFYDARVGRCVKSNNVDFGCPDGFQWDAAGRVCQPMANICPPGAFFDHNSNTCVQNIDNARIGNIKGCPAGYVFDPASGWCMLPEDMPVVDTPLPIHNPQQREELARMGVINPADGPMHNIAMPEYSSDWVDLETGAWENEQEWKAKPDPAKLADGSDMVLTGDDGNQDRESLWHGTGFTLGNDPPPNDVPAHDIAMPGYVNGR